MTDFLRNRALVLAVVFGASVLVHLKGIASPPLDYHYHRQCNTAAIARNYHENGLRFLCPQIDWEGGYRGCSATEFPLYMWLIGLFWSLAGLGDLWGRVLAVLFSALTAVYLLKLLESCMEEEAAFYGAVLFSFIPLEIYFGRTIQPEALSLLGAVAGIYHWKESVRPDRPWGHWLAAVVWSFLSIGHKLPYIYMLIPMAGLSVLALRWGMAKDLRTWLGPTLILGGVFAWYKYASAGKYVVPTNTNEFVSLLQYGRLPYYVQFQFLSRFPELAATYGGVVLGFFGARELVWRRQRHFFAVWFLGIAAHIVAGGYYMHQHEYTSLPFAPVNAAFMGLGLLLLKRAALARGTRWAAAGVALLALSVPVHAALRIKHWYKVGYPFLAHAREAADRVSRPDDLFLCNERGSSVYLYYLKRRGWSWELSEAGEKRIGEVEGKIAAGAKYYMTDKKLYFQDRQSFYAKWFFSRFPVIYDDNGIMIFRLRPTGGSPRTSAGRRACGPPPRKRGSPSGSS